MATISIVCFNFAFRVGSSCSVAGTRVKIRRRFHRRLTSSRSSVTVGVAQWRAVGQRRRRQSGHRARAAREGPRLLRRPAQRVYARRLLRLLCVFAVLLFDFVFANAKPISADTDYAVAEKHAQVNTHRRPRTLKFFN
jgi:hypothetical protein